MAQTITPKIVTVNTLVAPAPQVSQLQQSGAIVSAGGTTAAADSLTYCGNLASVQALQAAPLPITSLAWATGEVTATVAASTALTVGDTFTVDVAGAVPAGYNGTFLATVVGDTEFTYPVTVNPGTETTPGTYTAPGVSFVEHAAETYFAQGSSVGIYVLELGAQATATAAVTALGTWITDNASPQQVYTYIIDPAWDAGDAAGLAALAKEYEAPSGQTYFAVQTTSSNLTNYAGIKSVLAIVPTSAAPLSELDNAALAYQWLVNQPGAANPLAPMAFRYLYDVTPWPASGSATAQNAVLTAFGNLVATGAEGGISTSALFRGTTMDGAQASTWFAVDWFRIQVAQALAGAIIQGSNSNPPLLYDQAGINTLQAIAQQIASNAVSYGCAASATVTAVPFATYVQQNPNDYSSGIYNGLSATITMQTGFESITFQLDAVNFQ